MENLRPLSLGEILDRTATIYRQNFLLLSGISAIVAAVNLLLGVANLLALKASGLNATSPGYLVFVEITSVIALFLMLCLQAIPASAITRAVSWVSLGEKATIGSAYASVMKRKWIYLGLLGLLALLVYGPYAVFTVIFFSFFNALGIGTGQAAAANMQAHPELLGSMLALIAVAAIVFPLLLSYMLWMGLRYSLALTACVVEDLGIGASLKRSVELTKGAKGRIFVLFLLFFVIRIGLSFLLDGPIMVVFFKQILRDPAGLHIGMQMLQQVVVFFVTAVTTPIYSAGLILFYYDQRVRKEGFDIERMMQAAGLSGGAVVAGVPAAELVAPTVELPPLPVVGDVESGTK